MSMIHRRALITGLLASVAVPAMARLAQAQTMSILDAVNHGLLQAGSYHDLVSTRYAEAARRSINSMVDNLYLPYGDPSFPITTPRQIRT